MNKIRKGDEVVVLEIDFKIYLPKDRSAAISLTDMDGNPGFTLDFSNDSLYLLAFLDYIDFDPHLMATPAKVKQDDWNDISLVFSPATNRIMVKLNGLTLLNAVDAAQTGYTYLDFSTLDVITAFGLRTEFYVDDIVYRRIPTVPNLQSKTTLPNVASITPNPANEQLVISPDVATRDAWQVRLLNNLGQAVLTQQGNENAPLTIAINDYKSGIYFVEFKSETAQWTKKVVIQH